MTETAPPPASLGGDPWPEGPPPQAGTAGRPGPLTLLIVLFTGPTLWAVHLAGAAALVPAACAHDLGWTINALTVLCAAPIAAATLWSWRLLVRYRPDGTRPDRVIALVALLGLAWGAISLLVTLVEGAPNLVLDACPL